MAGQCLFYPVPLYWGQANPRVGDKGLEEDTEPTQAEGSGQTKEQMFKPEVSRSPVWGCKESYSPK